MIRSASYVFSLIVLAGAAATAGEDERGVIEIGPRRELFVDDFLIQRLDGARLILHPPHPREVVMVFDRPWEDGAPGYVTVFQDGDRYRMYYRATHTPPEYGRKPTEPRREVTCYAESTDGMHWTRPELGLVEFEGSAKNNIMWDGAGSHNFTPFKDANPRCPSESRYKACGRGRPLADEPSPYQHGLYALQSADGIHWELVRDEPVITEGKFDSQNLMFWDAEHGLYRAYWRDSRRGDQNVPDGRDVRTATSQDGVHWGESRMLAYRPGRRGTRDTDGAAHQYYTNGVQVYHRAPHLFVGLPMRYIDRGWTASTDELPELARRKRISGQLKRLGTAITDTMFLTSRDGFVFHVWPEAFIRPGIARPGSWFYGDAATALGIVETRSAWEGAPNELSFYVRENARSEAPGRLRRYTLRLDGFVSAGASLTGGELLTKPLVFEGNRLEINFSTSAGGTVHVEIQDGEGTPVPGFTLGECHAQYGDQLDRIVSWRSGADVSKLAGKPARLRFILRDADLYSFRFVTLRSATACFKPRTPISRRPSSTIMPTAT